MTTKKAYNAKEIVKTINSGAMTLEEILSNNTLIHADIKPKFGKMTSFFICENIINKLIDYSLFLNEDSLNFCQYSHNSVELLSEIKNSQLLDKLTIEQEVESSEEEDEFEEEEEIDDASSSISNDFIEFVEFKEINTKDMDKELTYNSPVRSNSKKVTKKMSTSYPIRLYEINKKQTKKSFPYLDKLFNYLNQRKNDIDILLNVFNQSNNKECLKEKYSNTNQSNKSNNSKSSSVIFKNKFKESKDFSQVDYPSDNEKIEEMKEKDISINYNKNEEYSDLSKTKIVKSFSKKQTLLEIFHKSSTLKTKKLFNNSIQVNQIALTMTDQEILETINEILNDLLSGYFFRIFSNLILNRKAQVI